MLLVDTIGELGGWWGTATIGFVGGSLYSSRGGQNMIEPAAYGVALSFGPNTQNFRDVVEMLLGANAAVRVHSGDELSGFVRRCLEESNYASLLGRNAATVVRQQQGATGAPGTCWSRFCLTRRANKRFREAMPPRERVPIAGPGKRRYNSPRRGVRGTYTVAIAQLVRAPDCGSGGHGFKSR